ncbi:MAG: CapA family protein [Ruminococcaceae bacterium]|nr:CapA family protein [Oscillospiraceae bacterium]
MKIKKIVSAILFMGFVLSCASCGLVQTKDTPVGTGRFEESGTESSKTSNTPTDLEPKDVRISFAAAGDNLIHESVYNTAKANATALAASGGPEMDYYFNTMYSENLQKIIAGADIAFVNQEAPIVPEYPADGYPNFNTPTEAGDALVEIGFDIVNLANNHMLDMDGKCEGLRSTIEYWKTKNILPIGAYESSEDYNTIRIMESKGKRIAVLSYTYGTNNNLNANSRDLVVPYINDSTIIEQVSRASENADAVIVSMHWGTENAFEPSSEQKRLATLLSKYGADVVIGHHSHTLQPMEWVTNDAGDRTLVIYSLGNLISSQVEAYKLVGGLATFELVFSTDGKLTVENVMLNPTVTHYSSDGSKRDGFGLPVRYDVSVGLLEDYNSDKCEAHGSQHPDLGGAFTLDTLKGYVTGAIDAQFLPEFLK